MLKGRFYVVLSLFLLVLCGNAYALEGTGTIQEIRVCAAGNSDGRMNHVFFKLSDGNWFGVYGDYTKGSQTGVVQADSASQSVIIMAYANEDPVSARGTYTTVSECGVTAAMIYRNAEGDFISIQRE